MTQQAGPQEQQGPLEVEVEAFQGAPKQKVDLRNPAPFGYTTAGTLGLVALVDRADSAMVGGVLPTLQDYFNFGDGMAGILLSAPSVAALLLVVPAGRLADTRSRKLVLSIVILTWGLLTFGAAAAPTFALFFLARCLLGAATPLNIPASASIVGDMYRSEARTKAFALVRVMEYLGFPLGVAVGGIVGGSLGWRAAFLIMGIPAVLLSAFVAFRLREPVRGLADDLSVRAERAGIPVAIVEADEHAPAAHDAAEAAADEGKGETWRRIKEALGIATLRWIIIGQALLFAGVSGLFGFAATFFHRANGLHEGAAAAIAGMLGLVGLALGGAFASRIGDRYHGVRPGWRVFVSAIGLTIAAVAVLPFALIESLPLQIALYLLINFANIVALANLGAAQADVIPARLRGTGFATAQFLVTIGSSFGAVIVGVVSSYIIRRETDIESAQLKKAEEALEDAKESGASEAVVGPLQATFDQLDSVYGSAQALGIRWGIATLFIVLIAGSLTVFRARGSYEADAAAVLAEAEAGSKD